MDMFSLQRFDQGTSPSVKFIYLHVCSCLSMDWKTIYSLERFFCVAFSTGQGFKVHTLIVDVQHCLQVYILLQSTSNDELLSYNSCQVS